MPIAPIAASLDVFDDEEDDGWQDMPVVREDTFLSGLDEEDQKKYHYTPSVKGTRAINATGNLIDVDDFGNEWRSKAEQNESEYTRLRMREEDDVDEVHLRTKYLFDEDKAMTPLGQMQTTKDLLTEAQRIAYVGLCALVSREMSQSLRIGKRKELKAAADNLDLWALKIMGRLYYHMELEMQEQKMIESLAEHGVIADDLVPALMTTHTVSNPEYDPDEARRQALERKDDDAVSTTSGQTLVADAASSNLTPDPNTTPPPVVGDVGTSPAIPSKNPAGAPPIYQRTTKVFNDTSTSSIPGVTTSLSSADQNVTLDIRWTVLCDLFLVLIADSVYDARSRVLLENVAYKLGLGWLDVVKFESRITEALEIQEDVETLEHQGVIEGQQKAMRKKRYMMLGLATLGGGLVIGLSAGLLAPVIGAGLGAAFTTIGISGTTGFLAGVGGTAVITTGGVLTGSSIAARGMAHRTQLVRTFDILPLHNNKRVSCILTVPGFMTGPLDDVRLPFSVLDTIVGDVFSVLWEPEMIQETGSALKILTSEVLSQIGLTVLQATVMSALMSALQWPIILTKLGYLIDNPWNNALDRARAAGRVLAEILMQRHLGIRPMTLIGFSLGARVIFYALQELAKQKAFGIVQDVFLLGATLTASTKVWFEVRSVVSGRFVNAFARNDWVLNYLFRATSGGVGTVAGLRPVQNVPGLENVDVTDKIAGHMSYRTFMPLILDQLGFPVSADFFDEPEEPDFSGDRIVETEEDKNQKKSWFSKTNMKNERISRPPSAAPATWAKSKHGSHPNDEELPPRSSASSQQSDPSTVTPTSRPRTPTQSDGEPTSPEKDPASHLPKHAGFDLKALKEALKDIEAHSEELGVRSQPEKHSPQPPIAERATEEQVLRRSETGSSAPKAALLDERAGRSSHTQSGSEVEKGDDRAWHVHDDTASSPSSPTNSRLTTPRFGNALPISLSNDDASLPWGSSSLPRYPSGIVTSVTPYETRSPTSPPSPLSPRNASYSSSDTSWTAFSPSLGSSSLSFNNLDSLTTSPSAITKQAKGSIPPFSPAGVSGGQAGVTMSFGGMDGSVMSFGGADGSISMDPDPWQVPSRSSSLNSNLKGGISGAGGGLGSGGSNPWS